MMLTLRTFFAGALRVNLFLVLPLILLIGAYKAYERVQWDDGPFLQMARDWVEDTWPAMVFCIVFAGVVVGTASVAGREK